MSEGFLKSLPYSPEFVDINDLILKGPDGKSIPYLGCIAATVEATFLKGKEIDVLAVVVPSTAYHSEVPIVIGTNVIDKYKELSDETTGVPDVWKRAFIALHGFGGIVRSTNNHPLELQPFETITVSGQVRKHRDIESVVTEATDTASSRIGVCPRVVTLSKPGKTARVPVRIFNMSASVLSIPPKSVLCQLQEVKVIRQCNPFDNQKTTAFTRQQLATTPDMHNDEKAFSLSDIGLDLADSKLTDEQKETATQLFAKWQHVFSRGPTDLGHTNLVKHEIKLTDEKPFKEPFRRISPAMIEEVREHIAEMLEADAIRPSQSPFSSNVVLVRKKDGSLRFCIDFHKLNLRTVKDAQAIPRIEDSLHLLVGSKYFTKLDLKAGYWQVELREEDKAKTAFQVGNIGFYECNRMPFGLCNAPATFQRLMERAMGELNLRDCLIYLDDIIIFSDTFEQHLDRLEAVFEKLHTYNLKLKASKCEFFKPEVTYLGHVVSEDGIKTDPEKIKVLKDWPIPKCLKDVRKFLGFAGYYRRFVKGFASVVRPLNDLLVGYSTKKPTKRKVPFKWEAPQQQAFDTVIEKLSNPPVLAYADYKLPFKIHTDASCSGLGAVLYQCQDGLDRVIAYASRSLKPSERNYPAHKLEFLALKWAVTDKFHDYLYGAQFEVVTDNNPLTYVLSTAKLDATGHRWVAALANYNFAITYRSGKLNKDADGLSRQFEGNEPERIIYPDVLKAVISTCLVPEKEPMLVENIAVTNATQVQALDDLIPQDLLRSTALTATDWALGQNRDTEISRVKSLMKRSSKPSTRELASESPEVRKYLRDWAKLTIKDDVLYRTVVIKGDTYQQLVIPKEITDIVFKALHDDQGHQGRDRTAWLIKTRFFWLGMDSDIESRVRLCDRCIHRKTRPVPATELVSITTSAPMDLVCIDYLTLEPSKGGIENILVITDHFTRYAQAIPTRNQTARTTAKALFDHFFVHYGFPARLHSDKAQNFESKVIQQLCKIGGIKKTRTTPYHPMGNGQVERFNQTLLQMLGTLENSQKSDWKSYVPALVHAYNATRHDTTGVSPFSLMFGRQPRLAVDAFLGIKPNAESSTSQTEYARKLKARLDFAYRKATDEAQKQSERYKANYDLRVRENKLEVGDRVLVEKVGHRGKHKIADLWEEEPYTVLDQPLSDIPVFKVIREDGQGRVKTLHRNKLLPFFCLPKERDDTVTDDEIVTDSVEEAIPESDQENVSHYASSSDSDDHVESSDEPTPVRGTGNQSRPQRPQRRPQRQRKTPGWMATGQWVT